MKTAMKTASALYLSFLALTSGTVPATALAQVAAKVPIQSESAFGALPGRWVRPDGGYVINIKSVDASGKLDAAYANPNPLREEVCPVMPEEGWVTLGEGPGLGVEPDLGRLERFRVGDR